MAAKDIVVPRGSPEDVAATLKDADAIRSVLGFRAFALFTRGAGPLHAGEFAFPAGATLRQVLEILRTSRPIEHRITVREGLTAAQIAMKVDAAPALTGDTPIPPEGHVLPDTYAYEFGTTRAALMARMIAAMDRTLAKVWTGRDPGLPLDTPEQLLTLASIIERETAKPAERALVAAVYINRLRLGMKLQADPTVIYAVSGGEGTLDHPLTRADLSWDNPYNTYTSYGLPPGPIGSPGLASLQAAAHPASTDDLYFVADGTGGHVFAKTLEEHNRNVERWRALTAAQSAPPVATTPSAPVTATP